MSTRSSQRISIDDPRLTAFALGELEGSERAEIEQLLGASPECRQLVAELQELAGQLSQELQSESGEGLTPAAREAIAAASQGPAPAVAGPQPRRLRRWLLIGGGLASCTAAAVWAVMLAWPHTNSGGALVALGGTSEVGLRAYSAPGFGEAAPQSSPLSSRSEELRDRAKQLSDVALMMDDSVQPHDWAFGNGHGPAAGNGDTPVGDAYAETGKWDARRFHKQTSSGGSSAVRWKDEAGRDRYGRIAMDAESVEVESAPLSDDESQKKSQPTHLYAQNGHAGNGHAGNGQPLATLYTQSGKHDPAQAQGHPGRPGVPSPTPAKAPAPERYAVLDVAPASGRLPSLEYRTASEAERAEARLRKLEWEYSQQLTKDNTVHVDQLTRNETYEPIIENGFVSPRSQPLSTFSIDVDTASYANVRRFLTHNTVPPPAAVRLEELVNYFHYDDPQPADGVPFSVNCEVGACPWQVDHRLVRIGLKGREITREQRPPTNLVFLVDVSGSMAADNKLPLVKSSLQLLTEELDESDRIAIVTYAGTSGVLLDSITGDHRQTIMNAIGSLQSGGSTNGASGIELAYTTAVNHFIEGGSNRVILCTDGDFNVGVTDDDQLVTMIQAKAKTGVFLSVFGFGMGNLKDGKLEKLADKGNGHYGYIDSLREAQKAFVEDLFGTLVTIAKDVKIQVEFNPDHVSSYRLLGYENRVMATRDFRDDAKDAGEIGAGHSVTALYEFVPAKGGQAAPAGEKLKYQPQAAAAAGDVSPELLTVSLRYKQPTADKAVEFSQALVDPHHDRPSQNLQWASAVAAFGLTLRQSAHRGQASFALAKELAQGAVGPDKAGHRHEFIGLIDRAAQICPTTPTAPITTTKPVDPPQVRE